MSVAKSKSILVAAGESTSKDEDISAAVYDLFLIKIEMNFDIRLA